MHFVENFRTNTLEPYNVRSKRWPTPTLYLFQVLLTAPLPLASAARDSHKCQHLWTTCFVCGPSALSCCCACTVPDPCGCALLRYPDISITHSPLKHTYSQPTTPVVFLFMKLSYYLQVTGRQRACKCPAVCEDGKMIQITHYSSPSELHKLSCMKFIITQRYFTARNDLQPDHFLKWCSLFY